MDVKCETKNQDINKLGFVSLELGMMHQFEIQKNDDGNSVKTHSYFENEMLPIVQWKFMSFYAQCTVSGNPNFLRTLSKKEFLNIACEANTLSALFQAQSTNSYIPLVSSSAIYARICQVGLISQKLVHIAMLKSTRSYNNLIQYCSNIGEQGFYLAWTHIGHCFLNGNDVDKNDTKAFEWYLKAASKGNSAGQYNVGFCFANGEGAEQDQNKAFEWWLEAATQGDVDAQYKVGNCFEKGKGVEQDQNKAFEWYLKAASQGHASSQCNCANCFEKGKGVEQDKTKAFEWYHKAANQGNATAQNNVGFCFANAEGVEQDKTKAFEWYLKAANQGGAIAQYNVGFFLSNGEGVKQDNTKAFEWFLKAANQGDADAVHTVKILQSEEYSTIKKKAISSTHAKEMISWYTVQKNKFKEQLDLAELGDSFSQCTVAHCYANGNIVTKNNEMAVYWYQKSADSGFSEAQLQLANFYSTGIGIGEDKQKALSWYIKAANQGNQRAQWIVGNWHDYGIGTEKNMDVAFEWYSRAAKRCLQFVDMGAHFENSDKEKAFEWYLKAANSDSTNAQFIVGSCYEKGNGVVTNLSNAFIWYLKAAEAGHVLAKYNVGVCYARGIGAEQNWKSAFHWWLQAANSNDVDAQCNVGACYAKGKGTEKSLTEALSWYNKAADSNHRAQFLLGYTYFTYDPHDYNKAAYWFSLSSSKNHNSQCFLGICYAMGYGVVKDETKAISLLEPLADRGNIKAQYYVKLLSDSGFKIKLKPYFAFPLQLKDDVEEIEYAHCGASSIVYKATVENETVAIKAFTHDSCIPQPYIEHECAFVNDPKMHHPNLVRYKSVIRKGLQTFIVSEYANNGNLNKMIHCDASSLSLDNIIAFSLDICNALKHLHQHNVIHRDIKSENIMLHKDASKIMCKLCDYGATKDVSHVNAKTAYVGTVRWMAPEMFSNLPYNEKVDIWSFGAVLYEMLSKRIPFFHKEEALVAGHIKNGGSLLWPLPINKYLKEIVNECCQYNPTLRPSATTLLEKLDNISKLPDLDINDICSVKEVMFVVSEGNVVDKTVICKSSQVFQGTYVNEGETSVVALKYYQKPEDWNELECNAITKKMQLLNHSNIAKFVGCFDKDNP